MSNFSTISLNTSSAPLVGEPFLPHSNECNLPSRSYSAGRIAAIVICVTKGVFLCLCGAAAENPILIGAGLLLLATGAILAITAPKSSFPKAQANTPPPPPPPPPMWTPPAYTPQFSQPIQPVFITPSPMQPILLPVHIAPAPQSRVQVEDRETVFSPPPPQPIIPLNQTHRSLHRRIQTKRDTSPAQLPPPQPISAAPLPPQQHHHEPVHQITKTPLPPPHEPITHSHHSPTPLPPPRHESTPKAPSQTRTVVGDKKTPGVENTSSSVSQSGRRISVKKKD